MEALLRCRGGTRSGFTAFINGLICQADTTTLSQIKRHPWGPGRLSDHPQANFLVPLHNIPTISASLTRPNTTDNIRGNPAFAEEIPISLYATFVFQLHPPIAVLAMRTDV